MKLPVHHLPKEADVRGAVLRFDALVTECMQLPPLRSWMDASWPKRIHFGQGGTSLEEGWKKHALRQEHFAKDFGQAGGIARKPGSSSELPVTMPTVRYFDLWLLVITTSRNST